MYTLQDTLRLQHCISVELLEYLNDLDTEHVYVKLSDVIAAMTKESLMDPRICNIDVVIRDILNSERCIGHWTWDEPDSGNQFLGDWRCSICNYPVGNRKENFCPHCGADMRG